MEEPFNWSGTYANWESLSRSGMLRRSCSLQQMMRPGSQFNLTDMLSALRTHHCNDEWTEGMHCVCMHARNLVLPTDLDCQTTNSMIAVMKPVDPMILSPGMSTPCIAPFQPFWFDAWSDRQVFAYDRQEQAMASWLHREQLNRAAIDGRLPLEEYRWEMHAMERAWLAQAQSVAREDRQELVDQNAAEAEAFFEKWIAIADRNAALPRGDEGFRAWWAEKNAALGKDRRIAY